ncbi:hypothetical protein KIW84_075063 [Lathyrus oleraceus]|uniref:Uncharacterized protein n=1 Tax=Pisum sativum TaxID=3888 RepID=A0A9D4VUD2_PEA|nr:hypothetical protein KIW84_075063 [Pisum sativum]
MTENSVIQLHEPFEQFSGFLSDDKSENKNLQNVQKQTQPVPAQVNSNSANKPSDPPTGDGVKDISLPNEPREMSDAVIGPVEDQT